MRRCAASFSSHKSSLSRRQSYTPRPDPLLQTLCARSPSLTEAELPSNCYHCGTDLPLFSPLRRLCCLCRLSICLQDSVELRISNRPQIRCIRCHETTLAEPYDWELGRKVELLDYRLAEMEEESMGFGQVDAEYRDSIKDFEAEEEGLRADIRDLEKTLKELERLIDPEEAKTLQIALEAAKSARSLSESRLEQASKQLYQAETLFTSSQKQNLLISGQIAELHRAIGQRIPASFLKSTLCQQCYPRFRSVFGETSLATSAHSKPKRGEEPETCCLWPK